MHSLINGQLADLIEQTRNINIIYKYRSFEPYHFRLISHSELYFAKRDELNDPFETKFFPKYNFDEFTLLVMKHLDEAIQTKIVSFENEDDLTTWRNHEIEKLVTKENHEITNSHVDSLLNSCRVCCFTADNCYDRKLWSLYGDRGYGFCIGINFDLIRDFLRRYYSGKVTPLKVQYGEDYPVLNPFIINQDFNTFYKCFAYKTNDWLYENELRLVMMEDLRPVFKIPNKFVEHIILGEYVSEDNIKKVINELKSKKHQPKLFQIKLMSNSIEYIKMEIEY